VSGLAQGGTAGRVGEFGDEVLRCGGFVAEAKSYTNGVGIRFVAVGMNQGYFCEEDREEIRCVDLWRRSIDFAGERWRVLSR
jgi:hypothetical protein